MDKKKALFKNLYLWLLLFTIIYAWGSLSGFALTLNLLHISKGEKLKDFVSSPPINECCWFTRSDGEWIRIQTDEDFERLSAESGWAVWHLKVRMLWLVWWPIIIPVAVILAAMLADDVIFLVIFLYGRLRKDVMQ